MKDANLISLINAYKTLNKDSFESYIKYFSIKIKEEELQDLEMFIEQLKSKSTVIDVFDKYFIGYSIPQIAKQFDLLRIGDTSVVNIELKRRSTSEKISYQLLRNRYYLAFLNKKVYSYTFVSEENKLYSIDENNNLIETDIKQLFTTLHSQKAEKIKDIDSYFSPSNYLVSPFNSTHEFIKGNYFLTSQQEEIKAFILDHINRTEYSIVSVKGKAGTGKTLLTYDIAHQLLSQKRVLLIHCGMTNGGHDILRDNYGWNIIPVKDVMSQDYSLYDLVIVDEAQRIYKGQLSRIITEVKEHNIKCIFSSDAQQTLRKEEINNNVDGIIANELTIAPFELTDKIRTNKEIASFIHCLFDKKRSIVKYKYTSIEVTYFNDVELARHFLSQLKGENWKTINYTPNKRLAMPYSRHAISFEPDNAHTVIGQEFDNVVAVIDEYFYYKNDGRLSTRNYKYGPYYHPTKMLFQIVSRTRINLQIVIIGNQEILNRCMEILSQEN